MKFPGAVLLKGDDDPQPEFYRSVEPALPPAWGIHCPGHGLAGAASTYVNSGATYFNMTTSVANTGGAASTFYPASNVSGNWLASGSSPIIYHGEPVEDPYYWLASANITPAPEWQIAAANMSRALTDLQAQVTEPEADDEPSAGPEMTVQTGDADAQAPGPVTALGSGSQDRVGAFRRRRAVVSPQKLTGLAVFIAGRERVAMGNEWRSHLAGETGAGLAADQQVREAAGFILAAVQYRFQDAVDLTWRPVDAVLGSRMLSNLVVLIPALAVSVIFTRQGGLYELAANWVNVSAVWVAACGLIHYGRKSRDVKPPKHEPRRAKELSLLRCWQASELPGSASVLLTCTDATGNAAFRRLPTAFR